MYSLCLLTAYLKSGLEKEAVETKIEVWMLSGD